MFFKEVLMGSNTGMTNVKSNRNGVMFGIYDFYDKMEKNKIMLSFKGEISSELLTSILQIMESKLEHIKEAPKVKKKVYNVLVECLQNLYHHIDEIPQYESALPENSKTAIFMIGRDNGRYTIITGNYIIRKNVDPLQKHLDQINAMDRDTLKAYYKEVLAEGEISEKGGGGLGMIDIARKSGQKLEYHFLPIDEKYSFFTLNINISQNESTHE